MESMNSTNVMAVQVTSLLPRCGGIDKQADAPVLAQLVMASSELSMEARVVCITGY